MKARILNVLIALDQLAYVLLTLGAGHPDETLSAAAWRWEHAGKLVGRVLRPLVDTLFWFDPKHCQTSFESEVNRLHLPPEYRQQDAKGHHPK